MTKLTKDVAERYDIKGKNILASPEKYYAGDIGFRNVISSDIVDLSRNGIVHYNIIDFLLDEKDT